MHRPPLPLLLPPPLRHDHDPNHRNRVPCHRHNHSDCDNSCFSHCSGCCGHCYHHCGQCLGRRCGGCLCLCCLIAMIATSATACTPTVAVHNHGRCGHGHGCHGRVLTAETTAAAVGSKATALAAATRPRPPCRGHRHPRLRLWRPQSPAAATAVTSQPWPRLQRLRPRLLPSSATTTAAASPVAATTAIATAAIDLGRDRQLLLRTPRPGRCRGPPLIPRQTRRPTSLTGTPPPARTGSLPVARRRRPPAPRPCP